MSCRLGRGARRPLVKFPSSLVDALSNSSVDTMEDWLASPPLVTTLRIHRCSVQQFIEKLRAQEQYVGSCIDHPSLPDVLILKSDLSKESFAAAVSVFNKRFEWIVVDVICGAAVLRGADVYIPGILAASDFETGDAVEIFVNTGAHVLKGAKDPCSLKECKRIAFGSALVSRSDIFSAVGRKTGVGVKVKWTKVRHPNFNSWSKETQEHFFPQNLPAILVGHVAVNAYRKHFPELKPKLVLDMCAAPGGKATHIASLLEESAQIVAVDRSRRRLESVKKNAQRLALTNIVSFCYDSTKLCRDSRSTVTGQWDSEGCETELKPPFQPATFDIVLLDPPCSALGQRPVFKIEMDDKTVMSHATLQKTLFHTAVSLLKNGGILVFSTCTLTLVENEDMVVWALKTFPSLTLVHALPKLGADGHGKSSLSVDHRKMVQRFSPGACGDLDTVGFFIACFKKNCLR